MRSATGIKFYRVWNGIDNVRWMSHPPEGFIMRHGDNFANLDGRFSTYHVALHCPFDDGGVRWQAYTALTKFSSRQIK